jgi:hypothetical protein
MTQHHQQRPMLGFVEVDRAFGLRQPQLHPAPRQGLDHPVCLAAGERPLELTHHDRIELSIRFGGRGQQDSRLRTLRPRHTARRTRIEKLHHNLATTRDQSLRPFYLPCPRRHRILILTRRDAPVKRKPQTADNTRLPTAPQSRNRRRCR